MGGGASKTSRPASVVKGRKGGGPAALGTVLSKHGITKIVMIRHANAQPRDPQAAAVEAGEVLKPDTPFANAWTIGDLTRELTDKGAQQAIAARSWLNELDLRAVITSEAARAMATKDIMTSGKFPKGMPGCLILHTLHPSRSGTPDCERMFDKLGYGTLRTYFADQSIEGLEGKGRECFRAYMTKVTDELQELISAGAAAGLPGNGDTVCVFGHAVFLNAVAVAVGEAMGISGAEDKVAEIELGEAQGILCDRGEQDIHLAHS